ncbi:hypothetical protein [Nocardia sp. NBC_00403]
MIVRNDTGIADPAVTAAIPALDTDPAAAVAQMRRACRDNGFALFTIADPNAPGRTILAETARSLGLGDAYIPPVYTADAGRYG